MSLDYQKILGRPADQVKQRYTRTDCILYALGIGVGQIDPTDARELQFVHEHGLQALPMMATVLAPEPFWMMEPQWGIDWKRIVHGEQMLTLHKSLPPEGTVSSTTVVEEIYDKGPGRGALLYLKRQLFDDDGGLLAEIGKSAFLRGAGGFGGPPGTASRLPDTPDDRAPDAVLELPTRCEQALIYRLCGDRNPLHIDPQVAASAGFSRPILHGLCTYGIAGRALIRLLCNDEASRMRKLDARFAAPVYPGESIVTEVWRTGPGHASFRCIVPQRGAIVLTNGRFECV